MATSPAGYRLVVQEESARETVTLVPGQELTVGRLGDVPLGASPEDLCVSRLALEVTVIAQGWQLEVPNAAGAWVQPWMSPRRRVTQGHRERFDRARVCIDVMGADDVRHRVLLERDGPLPAHPTVGGVPGLDSARAGGTVQVSEPRALTDKQVSVLTAVFGEFFAWPPREAPRVAKFRTAGKSLGISDSGIKDHLNRMKARLAAFSIGHVTLDDPRWVYALVDLGLLAFPGVAPTREPSPRAEVDLRDGLGVEPT